MISRDALLKLITRFYGSVGTGKWSLITIVDDIATFRAKKHCICFDNYLLDISINFLQYSCTHCFFMRRK